MFPFRQSAGAVPRRRLGVTSFQAAAGSMRKTASTTNARATCLAASLRAPIKGTLLGWTYTEDGPSSDRTAGSFLAVFG